MVKRIIELLCCCFLGFACEPQKIQTEKLTDWVDPFIGTDYHGHTFPGAAYPFGMIQLSPDNGTTGWDWCSGYHYSDSLIAGFSHTHLSGTGIKKLKPLILNMESLIQIFTELVFLIKKRKPGRDIML